jgi:uncharacterized membrane protein (UPF0127 family)
MTNPPLRIIHARSFGARLGGLLARAPLEHHEALLLSPCASVHTFFMRYAIDVAFCSRDGTVLKVVTLKPWRMAACRGARTTLELRAGMAAHHGVVVGKRLDSIAEGMS